MPSYYIEKHFQEAREALLAAENIEKYMRQALEVAQEALLHVEVIFDPGYGEVCPSCSEEGGTPHLDSCETAAALATIKGVLYGDV